jgi:Four helix bundle sensory module for signal transduction
MFSSVRIGARLLILVAIQCLLMIAVGLTGLSGAAQTNGRPHGVYEESIVPLLRLDSILNQNFQIRAQLDEALSTDTAAEAEKHLQRIKGFEAEAENAWKDYSATPMNPGQRQLAEAAAQAQQTMITARQQVVAALRMYGRAAAAEVDKRAERSSKFDRWREAMDKVVEYQARGAQSDYQAAN